MINICLYVYSKKNIKIYLYFFILFKFFVKMFIYDVFYMFYLKKLILKIVHCIQLRNNILKIN